MRPQKKKIWYIQTMHIFVSFPPKCASWFIFLVTLLVSMWGRSTCYFHCLTYLCCWRTVTMEQTFSIIVVSYQFHMLGIFFVIFDSFFFFFALNICDYLLIYCICSIHSPDRNSSRVFVSHTTSKWIVLWKHCSRWPFSPYYFYYYYFCGIWNTRYQFTAENVLLFYSRSSFMKNECEWECIVRGKLMPFISHTFYSCTWFSFFDPLS